jgi:hypothetical protein
LFNLLLHSRVSLPVWAVLTSVAQLRVRAPLATLVQPRGNLLVERLWRPATSARKAPTAWAMPRNWRHASSARYPRAATVRLALRRLQARCAPRAAPAPARLRMRVRRDVLRGARSIATIACEWGGVHNYAMQSRVPATPATLVQQRANLLVERLWRPATNARKAPTAWGMPRNRRRASSARYPRENTVRLARQRLQA